MIPLSGLAPALLVVLPAVAFAAGCPTAGSETATVAEAIDGETVRLTDGVVVRLAGIEAPKPPLTVLRGAAWPIAEAAESELRELVGSGAVGVAPTTADPDRYGRRHAYLFLADGRSVAGELIAGGFARVRWLPGESACLGAFLGVERAARAAKRGLWASSDYAVRRAEDPSLLERNGLYELVEGRVVSVGHGSSMIFLDFGRNYRSDFTILVAPLVADALLGAGVPVDGLANRRVRVRGVIEDQSGPAIRLNDPAEIELVDE